MGLKSASSFGVISDDVDLARIDLSLDRQSINTIKCIILFSFLCREVVLDIQILHQCIVLKNLLYTLKTSTNIKINFTKLLPHVSVPLDHHQGARLSYPKVTLG